jgi:hypothetical protein
VLVQGNARTCLARFRRRGGQTNNLTVVLVVQPEHQEEAGTKELRPVQRLWVHRRDAQDELRFGEGAWQAEVGSQEREWCGE